MYMYKEFFKLFGENKVNIDTIELDTLVLRSSVRLQLMAIQIIRTIAVSQQYMVTQ